MGAIVSGIYVSEDNNFKLEVISSNDTNGVIEVSYNANYSPIGNLNVEGVIGNYAFINTTTVPCSVRFDVFERPDGRPYVIRDSWVGIYESKTTFLLEGTRSYLDTKGIKEVGNLGTLRFSRQ
jgi:hypothetical protein